MNLQLIFYYKTLLTQAPDEDVVVGGGDAIRTGVSVMGSTSVGPRVAVDASTAVDGWQCQLIVFVLAFYSFIHSLYLLCSHSYPEHFSDLSQHDHFKFNSNLKTIF